MTDDSFPFVTKPGWIGHWIEGQAAGAMPNGTRIVKVKTEKNDTHAIGAKGTVLSSVDHPELGIAYFVEWDDAKMIAVLCIRWKIAEDKEKGRESDSPGP